LADTGKAPAPRGPGLLLSPRRAVWPAPALRRTGFAGVRVTLNPGAKRRVHNPVRKAPAGEPAW